MGDPGSALLLPLTARAVMTLTPKGEVLGAGLAGPRGSSLGTGTKAAHILPLKLAGAAEVVLHPLRPGACRCYLCL